MRHHCADHEQGAQVTERDCPERPRAHRLLRREVDIGEAFGADRLPIGNDLGPAIDLFADFSWAAVEVLGQPPRDSSAPDASDRSSRAPAEPCERQHHERDTHAARCEAHAAECQRAGPQPFEPSHDRNGDGQKAAECAADGHDQERAVELPQRVQLAEPHETDRHAHSACPGDGFGPEPVDQPALRRPQQRRLGSIHGERARQGGLAPAVLPLDLHQVGAQRVHHECALQPLDHCPCAHHLPAAEGGGAFGHRYILPDEAAAASVQNPSLG